MNGFLALLAGVAGALVTGFFAWLKARAERKRQDAREARQDAKDKRQEDVVAQRDIADIVNQRVEMAFKYWQTIFDEREEDLTKLLNRVRELTQERDALADRVRELGDEVEDVKRKRRHDQETIAALRAELDELRRTNGH